MEKISNDPYETKSIGFEFSSNIAKGDIIAINGEIGAGKTTFIKGILQGLGYKGNVSSATYTLVNEYESEYKIFHIDCYREKKIDRWLDIGIMDYLNGDNVVIIEWSEYIKNILPSDITNVHIAHISELKRKIKILL